MSTDSQLVYHKRNLNDNISNNTYICSVCKHSEKNNKCINYTEECVDACKNINVDQATKDYIDCRIKKLEEQISFLMNVIYNIKC